MRTEEIRVNCIVVKQNFKRFKKDLNQGKLTKDENIYMPSSAGDVLRKSDEIFFSFIAHCKRNDFL